MREAEIDAAITAAKDSIRELMAEAERLTKRIDTIYRQLIPRHEAKLKHLKEQLSETRTERLPFEDTLL